MGASSRRTHLIKRPSSSLLIITGRSLLLLARSQKVHQHKKGVPYDTPDRLINGSEFSIHKFSADTLHCCEQFFGCFF